MREIDTLIHAGWIIPVEPDQVVLEDHSIAIHQGRILEVLPHAMARSAFSAATELTLERHVLIPGLINSHTHAAMTLLRGLADDLPLMEWLNDHIWPAESRWVSEDFTRCGTQLAIAEMLRGGVTCFNDMYFYPDVVARTAGAAGMRACVGLIVLDFPTVWAGDAEEYISRGLTVHDQYRSDPLIGTAFAPHAPYTVSDQPLEHVRMLADELDIPVHMHVHETREEVERARAETGLRPLERLSRLGLVSPSLLAVHMTQVTDEEIATLAESGGYVIHCPESNMKLASGLCPVKKLQDAGVPVALATDGAASNNDLDMLGEMRTAALLGKAVSKDARTLPAHRVLRMATLDGATALGLGAETGSIETGKWADLTAIRMDGIESEPVYHPLSHLVYATNRSQVTDVWVAGKHLLKERSLTTLDREELLGQVREWRERISGSDPAAGQANRDR